MNFLLSVLFIAGCCKLWNDSREQNDQSTLHRCLRRNKTKKLFSSLIGVVILLFNLIDVLLFRSWLLKFLRKLYKVINTLTVRNDSAGNSLQHTTIPSSDQSAEEIRQTIKHIQLSFINTYIFALLDTIIKLDISNSLSFALME